MEGTSEKERSYKSNKSGPIPAFHSAKNNNIFFKKEIRQDKKHGTIYSTKTITFDRIERKNKENELLQSIANYESITIEKIQIAEKIDFKTLPDSIINTDEFGFILEDNSSDIDSGNEFPDKKDPKSDKKEIKEKNEKLLTINARIEKWNYMLNNFNDFKKNKFYKLKERTRKGIPDNLRGYAWQLLSGVDEFYKKNLYQQLEKEPVDRAIEDIIINDIDRTFPKCQFFKDKYGNGQRKLLKVLSNYSKYNKEVGYIQGMAFICALLLTYMDEERSFFMLHTLIKKYDLEGIYLPGFRDLKKKFFVLLNLEKKFLPKCYRVLQKDEVYPGSYASEWFICLFARNLDFNILVRIFDTFLLEGFKVIYRFSLAFIKLKEKDLIESKNGIDSTILVMNNCLKNVNVDELFKVAFGFSLSKKLIEGYEKEYDLVKNNKKNEFMVQV